MVSSGKKREKERERTTFMIGDERIRCERIMEWRRQREGISIRSSTLNALIDREMNAKRKPRLNDQTEESLVLVDGMPSF